LNLNYAGDLVNLNYAGPGPGHGDRDLGSESLGAAAGELERTTPGSLGGPSRLTDRLVTEVTVPVPRRARDNLNAWAGPGPEFRFRYRGPARRGSPDPWQRLHLAKAR
jgi:hypothetical protein